MWVGCVSTPKIMRSLQKVNQIHCHGARQKMMTMMRMGELLLCANQPEWGLFRVAVEKSLQRGRGCYTLPLGRDAGSLQKAIWKEEQWPEDVKKVTQWQWVLVNSQNSTIGYWREALKRFVEAPPCACASVVGVRGGGLAGQWQNRIKGRTSIMVGNESTWRWWMDGKMTVCHNQPVDRDSERCRTISTESSIQWVYE